MLSAKAQDEDIQKGVEVGVDEYITKPFSPEHLVHVVNDHMSRAKQSDGRGRRVNEVAPGVARLPTAVRERLFRRRAGRPLGAGGRRRCRASAGQDSRPPPRRATARARKPAAIVLTHGHLDHAGSLADSRPRSGTCPFTRITWRCRISRGKSLYPPFDPTVGGFFAFLTRFLPARQLRLRATICVNCPPTARCPTCPAGSGSTRPAIPPATSPSGARATARCIAGDAFVTVDMSKFTPSADAEAGVDPAADPRHPATGPPPASPSAPRRPRPLHRCHRPRDARSAARTSPATCRLRRALPLPAHGRYVTEPARADDSGVVSLPPPVPDPLPKQVAIGASVLAAAFWRWPVGGTRTRRVGGMARKGPSPSNVARMEGRPVREGVASHAPPRGAFRRLTRRGRPVRSTWQGPGLPCPHLPNVTPAPATVSPNR